ncbi:DUF2313 domain-containing protein [Paenibacillus validus]|nr:DUF2313 domain-containing protein [Paenibacillus validus]MED4606105.1 DUF2313 domain-containing protein [Paenibacillus validus]
MIKQLQPFQRKSAVYKAIFDAKASQFENRAAAIADLQLQLSVDTATWALDIYEKDHGIPTDRSKPYSERRSVIKSKMRGTGKVDSVLIEITAESWTNGEVEVSFDGQIVIKFISEVGTPSGIDDLKKAIEEIKPAHLAVRYEYKYLSIADVESMTIDQLETITFDKLAWR